MNELGKLNRAKMYIDKMIEGYDPITDTKAPENDVINQPRITKCFEYISEVLGKVIDNNGHIERVHKVEFDISDEQLQKFAFSDRPLPVSEISRRINGLIDPDAMKQFKYKKIIIYLIENGYLEQQKETGKKMKNRPTSKGKALGIFDDVIVGPYGPYIVILYNLKAQHFIIDHFRQIMEINDGETQERSFEKHFSTWTEDEERELKDMFQDGCKISEMSYALDRSEKGIRAKLIRMKLITEKAEVS